MKPLRRFCVFLALPILTAATLQRSDLSSPSYMAAVAEYSPVREASDGRSPADINADNYVKFIDKAADYAIDIIVFPESSLSTSSCFDGDGKSSCKAPSYIPAATDNVVPCDDDTGRYAYSLKRISCAARAHTMYVVVNHQEKADCLDADCPADGHQVYNTNVAFDRNGQVVARYRKYNLYGEAGVSVTDKPEASIFPTDFGVTFGQFICFDLLFETPTLSLVRDFNVTDIIFSSHWFSEMPYLYSVEVQAGWAYANDVNMLSAGYSQPRTASGGSGIFLGKSGYVEVVLENKRTNMLIMSEVPKVNRGQRKPVDGNKKHVYKFTRAEMPTTQVVDDTVYRYKIDPSLSVFTTELLDPTTKYYNKVLCDREFCCQFSLQIDFDESAVKSDSHYYRYRLAVFNGTRSFGTSSATGGVKTCSVIACTSSNLTSCGHLLDSSMDPSYVAPTTFRSIRIAVRNESGRDAFFMPITYTTAMLPLNATEFDYENAMMRESSAQYMQLRRPRSDLLTFAIYGRNFALDGGEPTGSSALRVSATAAVLIVAFSALFSVL